MPVLSSILRYVRGAPWISVDLQYQMAWVRLGKDEQGRRLLVTTMLHPIVWKFWFHIATFTGARGGGLRCEARRVGWSTPKVGLSHPGMPRQAAGCRGAVEALRIKSCHVPPKLTKLGIRVTMAYLDFPRDPNRDGGITHPMNPMFGRGKADGSQRLTLEAGRGLVGDGCTSWPWTGENRWSWVCLFQTGVLRTMDSPDKMMQHLDASNKNAVFFWIYPTRIIGWTQSSIDQPQAAFIHNCRSPGGAGRAKKSADGCLLFIAGWKGQEKGSGQTVVMWIYLNLFYRVATFV